MKKIHIIYSFVALLLFGSCEEYLDITPQDQITPDGYFETEAQCLQATSPLYGFAWFNMNDKASFAIGDLYGGNMYTSYHEFANFHNYSVAQNNVRMFEAWSTCYAAVAHANNIINNLPSVASKAGIGSTAINSYVAEAKFTRGTAYFFLARLFGSVPIIEDGGKTAANPIIPRIKEDDVYAFLIKDLEYAAAHSPLTREGSQIGRITSGAAKAMLAKVYLRIGEHAKAKTLLEEVIASNVYQLLPNYRDLFLGEASDNNAESIYAWHWIANQTWSTQNTHQAFFAVSGDITQVGDGWSTVIPSVDLLNAFEAGDKRRREIVMQDGDYYPELISSAGGFTYEEDKYGTDTNSGIKKYVIGGPDDNDGKVGFMSTGINTDVIRYADVLLMYVEAVMGSSNETSDTKALEYFNAVRTRAGLSTKSSVTRDELLQERRIEFAMEAQHFYDVVRILGKDGAKTYLSNVERGRIGVSQKYTCHAVTFEIPTSEGDQNPLLREDPVDYDWSQSEYSE